MKKCTLFTLLVFLVAAFCNSTQAQKIYTTSLQAADYAGRLTSNENLLKQQVHRNFATRKQITVVDFNAAVTRNAAAYRQTLQPYLRAEDFFSITNAAAFADFIKQKPGAITLVLPYKTKTLVADLVASDILTDDFKAATDKNPNGTAYQVGAFYKGIIRGTNAVTSISFFADHVEGLIALDEKTTVEITKMLGDNAGGQHVIYDDADLLVKATGHYCKELYPPASQMEKPQTHPADDKTSGVQYRCVKNFWETAYSVYQQLGSSKKVTDFVTSLFNVYATLYSNENISMKLKTTFVWTSQDPYNDDLNTFSNMRTGFDANTAVLLSDAATGGVAWLNTICQSGETYRHAYCGSILRYEQVLPITSYSWPAEVTAHEVGHNLGSPHTHACAWNGNNTAIDGCGPAAGYSEGCNGPIPTNGGTIMSYCHLISAGINFSKGFGGQPGTLILNNVKSCITTKCAPIGITCDAPTNVIAGSITGTTATISWKRVTGAAYYYIYLSGNGGTSYTLVADHLYSNTFTLTGLQKNHSYICAVWVACGNGNSNSTSVNFTTNASIVAAVADVQKNAFTVQPNPVHGSRFTVTLEKGYENAVIEIYNSSNSLVSKSYSAGAVRSFAAPQTKGLYYIKATLGDEVVSKKILVE